MEASTRAIAVENLVLGVLGGEVEGDDSLASILAIQEYCSSGE